MVSNQIFLNKKLVLESKKSSLQSLLINFNKAINEKNSKLSEKLLNTSCRTVKILENFYTC